MFRAGVESFLRTVRAGVSWRIGSDEPELIVGVDSSVVTGIECFDGTSMTGKFAVIIASPRIGLSMNSKSI